jgi:hypothetical protein
MTEAKRTMSVAIDEDLVDELKHVDETLLNQGIESIRVEVERRRRHRFLGAMLDDLDAEYGTVDESLVAKYRSLLS